VTRTAKQVFSTKYPTKEQRQLIRKMFCAINYQISWPNIGDESEKD
jgi:hypothetical protein